MLLSTPDLPRPLRGLLWLIDRLIVLGGLGMLLIVFGNATVRLVFDVDLDASMELGSFLMLWVTFLGGAAAAGRGTHMRVTEIVAALGPLSRRVVELCVDAAVCVVLIALVWYGSVITISNWAEETSILEWPVGIHYLAMPVGSVLSLIFVIHHAVSSRAWLRPSRLAP
jgi:TRAP-type transport system small permease protein